MRPFSEAPLALVALFAGAIACSSAGCASTTEDQEASRDWDATGAPKPAPGADDRAGCVPTTCEALGKTSGTADDGCGGTLDCATGTTCTPKTCAELGQTSGTADDGCGRTIDCGAATCADAKAGNGTKSAAADLGTMTDSPKTNRIVADLKLTDGEEDWFKFKVTDGAFGFNPRIDVSSTLESAEVSVFYVCDSPPDTSSCTNAQHTADNTVGKGCKAKGRVSLSTECNGLADSGTAYVRVKKSAADAQCSLYALIITVD